MTLRALYDVPAPAKLNLFLHIVGRRADGYHLLQSPFLLIDWADSLHFERRDDGLLQRHDLGPQLPVDDLCLRAARTLQQASACVLGADISIDKRLPSGAGMGGGSSDAASTLLALNRLWGLGWTRQRLATLALTIGADVPFFVCGDNAFVEGIGERITPIHLEPASYAVIKPAASLSTREIFEHPLLVRETDPVILTGSVGEADGLVAGRERCSPHNVRHAIGHGDFWHADFGHNDLQAPAEDRCPDVREVAGWLHTRFGNSRMTGSGSAVFARVGTELTPQTTMAADSLPAGWVGRLCRSLPSHPLRDWADTE